MSQVSISNPKEPHIVIGTNEHSSNKINQNIVNAEITRVPIKQQHELIYSELDLLKGTEFKKNYDQVIYSEVNTKN